MIGLSTISQLRKDLSTSALVAGIIVVLVGMTSSAILVFQAATVAGASPEDASSWLGALCLGMGIVTIALSLRYRAPILTAWSTPGAALVVAGATGYSLSEIIGAFLFSAALAFLCGTTGIFERLMNRIPIAIASALLAGVLIHFSLDCFVSLQTQPVLIGGMILFYVIGKKLAPRFTMLFVLVAAIAIAAGLDLLHFNDVQFSWTHFKWTQPAFSLRAILSLGLPLFLVTMASQNLTGLTVLKSNDFQTPVSPLITWTGAMNLLTAPFGGFSVNLAAITAAIAMGPEAHPDKQKRYVAGVFSGAIYIAIGLGAGTVTSLFAAFPKQMVFGIAGLALLGTISSSLHKAFDSEKHREAAMITFAIAASGVSLLGMGAAFWALVIGLTVRLIL